MNHTRSRRRLVGVALSLVILGGGYGLAPSPASAASSSTASVVTDGDFEQGTSQSVWTETRSSGTELIDQLGPNRTWAADLCDIDLCQSSSGGPGDTLVQTVAVPGQVTSATLSFAYSIATSEKNGNGSCNDWLRVGLGQNGVPDPSAYAQLCGSTAGQYRTVNLPVGGYLQRMGGTTVQVQLLGFTDSLYPTQFFVDNVSLTISFLITPSAPIVSNVTDCSAGQATLSWSVPQFPSPAQYPVQQYTITPYNQQGVAGAASTVPGTQTSATVSLNGGSTCYFTVSASNANGTGPPGGPTLPVAAVAALAAQQTSTGFPLSWSLQPGSAPAARYSVYVRDGAGSWLRWTDTAATGTTLFGFRGHSYQVYVEALDAAGRGVGPNGSGQAGTTVAASAATPGFTSLYAVDGFGQLHPASSPPLATTASWPGWSIARGLAVDGDGQGGQVLDGYGGLHPFGNAPALSVSGYWNGWDIARGVALRADGLGGYVLDGFGGLHPVGDAPALSVSAYWNGWDIARGVVLRTDGRSGYVLDGFGGVHPFGGAPAVAVSAYWNGWNIARGIAMNRGDAGGYVLDGFGGVHPFGGAPAVEVTAYWNGWDIARGLTMVGSTGYVLDGFGGFQRLGSSPTVITPNYLGRDVLRGLAGS